MIVGLVASATLRERQAAAVAVAEITEPALVHAAQLYVSLSDADATASRSFATGGVELSAQRDRYLKDIATAATELAALSETAAPTPAVRNDLQTIGIHLAEYAGTVETARTDNRQGYPVGAAYLRAASADLRATVLPAVLDIYKAEAERLDSAYGAATSAVALSRLFIFGGLLVAGFLVAQVWLARRTHRIFNPLLALAMLVAVGYPYCPASCWANALPIWGRLVVTVGRSRRSVECADSRHADADRRDPRTRWAWYEPGRVLDGFQDGHDSPSGLGRVRRLG